MDVSKLETLLVGEGQTLGNVFVAVTSGVKGAAGTETPTTRVLKQKDCVYEPRVMGILAGETLIVRNDDPHMHNVHAGPRRNPRFSVGQANQSDESSIRFMMSEQAIPIKCDVHPWMTAWVHVTEHPHFDVTKLDGRYTIPGLMPGEYEITAWHERFIENPLRAKVRVESGRATTLDFTFQGIQK